jgi:hypothetical protein
MDYTPSHEGPHQFNSYPSPSPTSMGRTPRACLVDPVSGSVWLLLVDDERLRRHDLTDAQWALLEPSMRHSRVRGTLQRPLGDHGRGVPPDPDGDAMAGFAGAVRAVADRLQPASALAPARVRPSQFADRGLHLGSGLRRLGVRPVGAVGEPVQTFIAIPANPAVHRLPGHPEPLGHLRHRHSA